MAALTFEGRWGFGSGPHRLGPITLFDVGPSGITTASSLPVKVFFVETANAPSTSYESAIDTIMKRVQTFYADQMAAHGYGRQTFDFNTTAGGQVEIEEIILPETYETYLTAAIEQATKTPQNALFDIVSNDTSGRFAGNANLFFMGFPNFQIENDIFRGAVLGGGTAWFQSGHTVVYQTSRFIARWDWRTAAHELGHLFGLLHDFSDNRYIMSYGGTNRDRISSSAAAQLNDNRIFQSGLSTIYAFDNSVFRRFWPTGNRYRIRGTNDYGDITWTFPTKPATIPANFSTRAIVELLFHANEWYVLIRYQDPATNNSWYSLVRYNSAFVYQSVVWNLDSGSKYYRDMKIDGSNIYLLNSRSEIETRNLTSGTESSSFDTGFGTKGFALTYNRIYAVQEGIIKAFDRSGVAVPADDTPTTNIQFLSTNFLPNGAGIIGDSLYFGGSTSATISNPQVFQFSGISQQPYSASWSPASYLTPDRTIRSVLTLSEDPGGETAPGTDTGFSSIDDFQVEKRSGLSEPYTWTIDPNWAIIALGTGPRRIILANPAATVTDGFYRLVVKKDAFGIGKPAVNTNTEEVEVGSYVESSITLGTAAADRSYRAAWTAPIYNCSTRVIQTTLALIEDPGSSFSVTSDFQIEKRSGLTGSYSWSVVTGWTFVSTGTGQIRTITATPATTVPPGIYRLVLKEDAFGTDKPIENIETSEVTVNAHSGYSATFETVTYTPSTRALNVPLTLSEDPGSNFQVANDFKVEKRNAISYPLVTSSGNYARVDTDNPEVFSTAINIPADLRGLGVDLTIRFQARLRNFGSDWVGNIALTTTGSTGASLITGTAEETINNTLYDQGNTVTFERIIPSATVANLTTFYIRFQRTAGTSETLFDQGRTDIFSAVWVTDSNWSFDYEGSGISRTIIATPDQSVGQSFYRLVLKEDAFAIDKPNADVVSSDIYVSNYVAPVASVTPSIAELSYQNNKVEWRIEILGKDISSYVARNNVGSIRQTLDTGFLTEFQTGDCQLTLQDPNGEFSTAKESNFFTERSWVNTGYLATLQIFGGFLNNNGDLEESLVFNGVIISVTQDAKTREVIIQAAENADISRHDITNFGISTGYTLREAPETSIRGSYNFDTRLSPVSDNSVSSTLKGTTRDGSAYSEVMAQKNTLDDYGDLQETNFALSHSNEGSQLLTETQVTDLTRPSVQAEFRAPFRYKSIQNTIRDIADHYGVRIADLSVADVESERHHFSALGRVGYNIPTDDDYLTEEYTIRGNVTDYVIDEATQTIYFLLSSKTSTIKPRLIKLDVLSDTWTVLTESFNHEEWWGLATSDYNTFYILKTTGIFERGLPRLGTYNPSEYNFAAPPQTNIRKYVHSEGTSENIITANTERPQLAMYYHYGFTPGNVTTYTSDERMGFLPDTRHGFQISRGVLWYRFASRAQFGLAYYKEGSGTTLHITIPRDGRNNEASFDFTIDEPNNRIYCAHTEQTSTNSRLFLYYKTLAASY